jgi:TRAP-type C4-dicarboxylate transport system permease small subunit
MPDADPPPSPGPSRWGPERWLAAAEITLGVVLVTVILVLTFIQAAQRHLPVDGWVWAGELARLSLVWLAFALAGYLMAHREHITLQVVDFLLPARALRAVHVFACLIVAAVAGAAAVDAAHLVVDGGPRSTAALGIPLSWTFVLPMLGLGLAAVRGLLAAVRPGPQPSEEAAR